MVKVLRMSERQIKLTIIDQSLKDFDGHHFDYNLRVASAATSAGLETSILAHNGFVPPPDFPVPVVNWFSKTSNESRRSRLSQIVFDVIMLLPPTLRRRALAAIRRARRDLLGGDEHRPTAPHLPKFGEEVVLGVARMGLTVEDHVFIHSIFNAELHALLEAIWDTDMVPNFHIVLRRDAEEPHVVSDPWGGIAVALAKIRSHPLLAARVHLYADTVPLAKQYNALLDQVRVTVLPIPLGCNDRADNRVSEPGAPLRLVYLGNARVEKGYDKLPDLAESLRKDYLDTGRLKLCAQSNPPIGLDEALIARAVTLLKRYPRDQVELIESPLSTAEFRKLLMSADIILLPYRVEDYRRRSSGLLIEAAGVGKPVVVPAGTWLEDEVPKGAAVLFGRDFSLSEAVCHAVDHYSEIAEAAQKAAPAMRQKHSATRLIATVIESAKNRNSGV